MLNEAISIIMTMIVLIILIWGCIWVFYKFMYPRAPKSMMPKEGDVTTPRNCNYCGNSLAEYRGVLETKSTVPIATESEVAPDTTQQKAELFFCNYEHQADFHAGKSYQA